MNIGNITSDNFNLDGNGKDIQIEVYEQLIGQLQQENKQLREKVNKFNIDKINNENKSLKGSCKILGEKNNNQRKELQRLNNKIEKLKVINEEYKKLNGELREENQKYKEVIDRIDKYIEKETRIYGLSMSIELGTHFDNILGILKEVE